MLCRPIALARLRREEKFPCGNFGTKVGRRRRSRVFSAHVMNVHVAADQLRALCRSRAAATNFGSSRVLVCCKRSRTCGRSIHPRIAADSSSPNVPITGKPYCTAALRPARSSINMAVAWISRARQMASNSRGLHSTRGRDRWAFAQLSRLARASCTL